MSFFTEVENQSYNSYGNKRPWISKEILSKRTTLEVSQHLPSNYTVIYRCDDKKSMILAQKQRTNGTE
jgi:hypothetical protein